MIPEFWTSRDEAYLASILGESVELPVPQTRLELFLAKIAGMSVETPEPQTRAEIYLAAILGANVALPVPVSRVDLYLAKIAGMDVEIPEPLTRIDEYLAEWAENGSGEIVTVTGTSPLSLPNAIAHAICRLVQYGKCTQASTPTPDAPVDIVCNNGTLKWDSVNQRVYADGTPEVLTVIANQNTDPTIVKATLASGTTEVRYNTTSSCIIAPVKPNTVYSIGFLTKPTGGSIFRAVTTKGLVSSSAQSVASIAYDLDMNNYATKTLNSGNEAEWMYVQLSNTMSAETFASIIIQEGNAIMPPQTATDIPMLLSVGDAKDEGEIISGGVTHRIGYHVFDGTETFSKSSAYGKAFLINAAYVAWGADRTKAVLCTHFLGLPQKSGGQEDNTCFFNATGHFYFRVTDNSDVDAWKAWLAEQYASGAPVIVWFVLAEETTEQTTPQPLSTVEGDNTVSWTAEVSGTVKEVEYAQAPSGGDNLVGSAIVGTAQAG